MKKKSVFILILCIALVGIIVWLAISGNMKDDELDFLSENSFCEENTSDLDWGISPDGTIFVATNPYIIGIRNGERVVLCTGLNNRYLPSGIPYRMLVTADEIIIKHKDSEVLYSYTEKRDFRGNIIDTMRTAIQINPTGEILESEDGMCYALYVENDHSFRIYQLCNNAGEMVWKCVFHYHMLLDGLGFFSVIGLGFTVFLSGIFLISIWLGHKAKKQQNVRYYPK